MNGPLCRFHRMVYLLMLRKGAKWAPNMQHEIINMVRMRTIGIECPQKMQPLQFILLHFRLQRESSTCVSTHCATHVSIKLWPGVPKLGWIGNMNQVLGTFPKTGSGFLGRCVSVGWVAGWGSANGGIYFVFFEPVSAVFLFFGYVPVPHSRLQAECMLVEHICRTLARQTQKRGIKWESWRSFDMYLNFECSLRQRKTNSSSHGIHEVRHAKYIGSVWDLRNALYFGHKASWKFSPKQIEHCVCVVCTLYMLLKILIHVGDKIFRMVLPIKSLHSCRD